MIIPLIIPLIIIPWIIPRRAQAWLESYLEAPNIPIIPLLIPNYSSSSSKNVEAKEPNCWDLLVIEIVAHFCLKL